MYHLNKFKADLKAISESHAQINTFGFGDLWEQDLTTSTSGVVYPMLWVEPGDASMTGNNGNLISMQFHLLFLDIVLKDESNKLEIWNDQMLTAVDVLTRIKQLDGQDNFNLSLSSNFSRVSESLGENDDQVAGWSVLITIQFRQLWDRCAIP